MSDNLVWLAIVHARRSPAGLPAFLHTPSDLAVDAAQRIARALWDQAT